MDGLLATSEIHGAPGAMRTPAAGADITVMIVAIDMEKHRTRRAGADDAVPGPRWPPPLRRRPPRRDRRAR